MPKICAALIKENGFRSSNIFHRKKQQVTGTSFQIHQTTFSFDQTTFQVHQTTFSIDRTTKSVNGTTIIGCIVPDHIRLVKIV